MDWDDFEDDDYDDIDLCMYINSLYDDDDDENQSNEKPLLEILRDFLSRLFC